MQQVDFSHINVYTATKDACVSNSLNISVVVAFFCTSVDVIHILNSAHKASLFSSTVFYVKGYTLDTPGGISFTSICSK